MPSVYDCFVYDGKKVPHLQRKWELRHPDGAIRPDVGRKCFSSSVLKLRRLCLRSWPEQFS